MNRKLILMNAKAVAIREINLQKEVTKLFGSLKAGYMPGIVYDTAWLARLSQENGRPLFPESLNWILNNQREDGSWGGKIEYHQDRVLSTLVALITLSNKHRRTGYEEQISKGEEYLWRNIDNLDKEKPNLIGFELLFPTALKKALQLQLDIPDYKTTPYEHLREHKITTILKELTYSNSTTLVYSIEFLDSNLDFSRVGDIQNVNGSVGNSPSATAYILHHVRNEAAFKYLEEVLALNNDGSAMAVYPFEVFEKAWPLYHFLELGLPIDQYLCEHVSDLKRAWRERGTSISRTSCLFDSDDTAMAFYILRRAGEKVSPRVFEHYENETHYKCFQYELDPSVSANVHILNVIRKCKDYKNRDKAVEKILEFLKHCRINGAYWKDKWHISPYYVTAHAIVALEGLDDSMMNKAIGWIIETQNPNGSWGFAEGTLEETAYALWALLYVNDHVEKMDLDVISEGVEYLAENFNTENYPELWVAKGLYCPKNVVNSVILSVLCKSYSTQSFDGSEI